MQTSSATSPHAASGGYQPEAHDTKKGKEPLWQGRADSLSPTPYPQVWPDENSVAAMIHLFQLYPAGYQVEEEEVVVVVVVVPFLYGGWSQVSHTEDKVQFPRTTLDRPPSVEHRMDILGENSFGTLGLQASNMVRIYSTEQLAHLVENTVYLYKHLLIISKSTMPIVDQTIRKSMNKWETIFGHKIVKSTEDDYGAFTTNTSRDQAELFRVCRSVMEDAVTQQFSQVWVAKPSVIVY